MIDHGKVKSTVEPQPKAVDENSVWISENVVPIAENVGEDNEFVGFEFDLKQYPKDEYIEVLSDANETLTTQLEDTQLALCEVYEMLA